VIDIRVHPDLFARILTEEQAQDDGSIVIDNNRLVSDPTVPENCVVVGDGDPKSMADEIERRARQDERNARYADGSWATDALTVSGRAWPPIDIGAPPPASERIRRNGGTPADAEALRKAQEKRQRKALKREEQERRTREGKGGGT
jgi:hypothetical protein